MVDLDVDVVSNPVHVHDLHSGRVLTFRVHVARGGFFTHLEGQAEGPWRRRWAVDRDELATAARDALTFPDRPAPDALSGWLGTALPGDGDLLVRPPAEPRSIDALEEREGLRLPAGVRDFLEVTDGVMLGGWTILGVRDLYTVEVEDVSFWQIAVGSGPEDDRRCLCDSDEQLVVLPSHESGLADAERVGTGLRTWMLRLADGREQAGGSN
jgi:hypothetical protein